MKRQKTLAAISMFIGSAWSVYAIIPLFMSDRSNSLAFLLFFIIPVMLFPALILFYYGFSFWKSPRSVYGETIIANLIGWTFVLGAFHLTEYFPKELAERARDYILPIAGITAIMTFTFTRSKNKTFFNFKDEVRVPPIGKCRGTVLGVCVFFIFQNLSEVIRPTASESPFLSLFISLSPFIIGILSYRISRSYFAKIEPYPVTGEKVPSLKSFSLHLKNN